MTASDVSVWLDALAGSHDRLSDLVSELDEEMLGRPSYCDGWSIAQVLSHIGSGAEILGRSVDAVVGGESPPSRDSFPKIWERWNAMAPLEVRDAALATDGEFVEKLEHLGDALDDLEFTLFGDAIHVDAVGLIGIRLSEHAIHTWDVAVALDSSALVDQDAASLLVDRLPHSIGRLGKPDRADVPLPFTVQIVTSQPERVLRLDVADVVTLTSPGDDAPGASTLHLPAEALLRLTYGRLDAAHSPTVAEGEEATLATLRSVFPGF